MKYEIDASDMLKWQSFLGQLPKKTRPILANGLNFFGNETVRSWSQSLADDTGLEAGAVLNLIKVIEATPDRLEFSADASDVIAANTQWLRPWEERDKADFEQDTLVKIVTVGDHLDCEICTEAAANSPYTLREVKQMAEKWANYVDPSPTAKLDVETNLLHPRCRCVYQPWTATRRMPLSFGGKGEMPKELMSARKLGQSVAGELKLALKVKL